MPGVHRLGRLSLVPAGDVHYQLKMPYRDGTTHVVLEPLDFKARLATLVPRPRVNLTHYHWVFIFIMFLMSVAADWYPQLSDCFQ